MKWLKRIPLRSARGGAIADAPEADPAMPLLDVWSLAVEKGKILFDKEVCQQYLQSVQNTSSIDRNWALSSINPRPYIVRLENVTVIPGTRILIDENNNARSDEISAGFQSFSLRPKRWEMEVLDGPRLSFTRPPLADEMIPVGIHLMGEHETNYFHWFTEILPRLYLYQKLTGETDLPLLVSDNLHENLYDLLRVVCGTGRTVRLLKSDRSYGVSTLIYPSDVTRIFDFYDRPPSLESTYLAVGLLKELVQDIKRGLHYVDRPDSGVRRLYVKRTSTYRTLLNEGEIEKFLIEKGFAVIDPGQLSVGEQLELFGRADVVIGPSGAALTNIAWCPEETKVLVLHSDHPFKKYPYWDALARVSGCRISYLSGPRAHKVEGMFEAHDDYSIPVESLWQRMMKLGCY